MTGQDDWLVPNGRGCLNMVTARNQGAKRPHGVLAKILRGELAVNRDLRMRTVGFDRRKDRFNFQQEFFK